MNLFWKHLAKFPHHGGQDLTPAPIRFYSRESTIIGSRRYSAKPKTHTPLALWLTMGIIADLPAME